uniref:Proprotein convertase subtilisin/kexin type 5a n=1 Tax=Cyprinus carpio carpio TaxID=630221 RepID=A0A8C1E302_CYPCA
MSPTALFPYAFLIWIGLHCVQTKIYTNRWAVKITGGSDAADLIAEKYGFVNMGGLVDHYQFQHSGIIKRSTIKSRENHSLIATETKLKWIQQQMVQKRVKRTDTMDQNPRHQGYTGKGVVVSILDNSIERQHPDLKQNYDAQASYDVNSNDPNPTPRYDATNENKSVCVSQSLLAVYVGVRMLDGDMTDMVEAQSLSLKQQYIDNYSSSWGPDDDVKTVDGPGPLAQLALENGIRKVSVKGHGSIFVWASGNGGRVKTTAHVMVTPTAFTPSQVGSTTQSGRKPWYLEECSSTLATTYSSGYSRSLGVVTTDLRQRCTDKHSGTSASAPMAAGIIALTLAANPALTWRDVQHIVVKTSRRGHLSASDWQSNGAGYDVSHLYGFGLMDAEAMVKEAETWKQVPPQHVCEENVVQTDRNISPERVLRSVFKSSGCSTQRLQWVVYLEHVVVRVTITHPHRGDLSVTLTSPSGTRSQPNDHSNEGFLKWEFMTTHCWGERPTGDWILDISYGQYPSSGQCHLCDHTCAQCVDAGAANCTSCDADRFGMDRYLFRGECVEVCPQAHFHTALKACEPCPSHCKLFSSATHCIRCEDSFYPNDGICNKLECGEGEVEDPEYDDCMSCEEGCNKCVLYNPKHCLACIGGYYKFEKGCYKHCPSKTYTVEETMSCVSCEHDCVSCDEDECYWCEADLFLSGYTFTDIFMHLAYTFYTNDLHCIHGSHFISLCIPLEIHGLQSWNCLQHALLLWFSTRGPGPIGWP